MTCERCGGNVAREERPQPTRIAGFSKSWPLLCDACLRAGTWKGGSREALNALVTGGPPDLEARERLAANYPSPYAGLEEAPGLEAPPWSAALPESLRP